MQAPGSVIGQYLVKVNLSCNLRLISVLIYHWNLLCHVPRCASRHLSENKLKTQITAKMWLKFLAIWLILTCMLEDMAWLCGWYEWLTFWAMWLSWVTLPISKSCGNPIRCINSRAFRNLKTLILRIIRRLSMKLIDHTLMITNLLIIDHHHHHYGRLWGGVLTRVGV